MRFVFFVVLLHTHLYVYTYTLTLTFVFMHIHTICLFVFLTLGTRQWGVETSLCRPVQLPTSSCLPLAPRHACKEHCVAPRMHALLDQSLASNVLCFFCTHSIQSRSLGQGHVFSMGHVVIGIRLSLEEAQMVTMGASGTRHIRPAKHRLLLCSCVVLDTHISAQITPQYLLQRKMQPNLGCTHLQPMSVQAAFMEQRGRT
jgi:hypothetical protein